MDEAPTPHAPPPFWQFLAEWLRTRDVKQREFARRVGVHETVVSKWLHRHNEVRIRPGSRTIPRLAIELNVSADEVLAMVQADEEELKDRRAVSHLAARTSATVDRSDPDFAAVSEVWPRLDASVRKTIREFAEAGARVLIRSSFGSPTLASAG